LTASPVAGGALGTGILLLGGLPPSGIFATEFAIILGGVARGYGPAAAIAAVLLALCFVAMAVHGSRIVWGHSGPVDAAREIDWSMVLRLALPLATVAVLGLWTPAPLAAAFDSIKAVMGVIGV